MVYQVCDFLWRLAAARPFVLGGHGEAALQAFFPNRLPVDWDLRVWPPQLPEPLSSWMATVMRRREQLAEPLRRALMTLGERLAADATTQDEIDAIPRVLFERAEAVGDRAHDFYEAGRAPIQWNDVADADTIAALQIPAGFGFGVGDAFPSSESVARSVVAALAARSAG